MSVKRPNGQISGQIGGASVKRPNGRLSYQRRPCQTEETGELDGVPTGYNLYVDGSISQVKCFIPFIYISTRHSFSNFLDNFYLNAIYD